MLGIGLSLWRPGGAGGGGGGGGVTWNPADKAASITLSGGDLIATGDTTASWRSARATAGRSTGKRYFELVLDAQAANGFAIAGLGQAGASLSNFVGVAANQFGFQSSGTRWLDGVSSAGWTTLSLGNVLSFACDFDTSPAVMAVTLRINNVVETSITVAAGTYFPMASVFNNARWTARFASSSWAYSAPSGYAEW